MLLIRNVDHKGSELTLETASTLNKYIAALSMESQQDYQKVRALIDDPEECKKFDQYVKNFRNQIAFHYDTGYIHKKVSRLPVTTEALRRLAKSGKPGKWIRQERGSETSERDTRRFEFADKVMDTAICREVWNIGDEYTGNGLQIEADKIIIWIYGYSRVFVRFASALCMRYFDEKKI